MDSFIKQLVDSGLSKNQAVIYELLIKRGSLRASSIVRQLDKALSRPMVYLVLSELETLGLVKKDDSGVVSRFVPEHPSHLHNLAESKKAAAESFANAAAAVIPKITSAYNLHFNKPGVRFFEGLAGVEQVLNETLENSNEVIYTYSDPETITKSVAEIDRIHVQKRLKLGIKKKLLLVDNPTSRKALENPSDTSLTDTRIINNPNSFPINAVIEIYNNKVAYITFSDQDNLTATVIDDPVIYQLHRYLFESEWCHAITNNTAKAKDGTKTKKSSNTKK